MQGLPVRPAPGGYLWRAPLLPAASRVRPAVPLHGRAARDGVAARPAQDASVGEIRQRAASSSTTETGGRAKRGWADGEVTAGRLHTVDAAGNIGYIVIDL